jgi:Raf kinase inhibitor-like YbhB/YbcL family protein
MSLFEHWELPALLFLALIPKMMDGGRAMMDIKITSNAFREGEMIPRKYTCDGPDVSPQLAWTSVPAGTASIAMVCDDPDAPRGTWVHWVIFNLPGDLRELHEGIPKEKELKNGARQGRNDFGDIGYGGPCPPALHRYYFKVYALDAMLSLPAGAAKSQLLKAMEGHVLGQGQLMGHYKR